MWTKLTIIGCLILTVFVVHTAVRIEHMNVVAGHFLPRPPEMEGLAWKVPEQENVREYVDYQIMLRRVNLYATEHPDEKMPASDTFFGAPYSPSEQDWIDRLMVAHQDHVRLHWWVNNFGALQYILAPICAVWAFGNLLSLPKRSVKALSLSCALLAFGAIFLMYVRGY